MGAYLDDDLQSPESPAGSGVGDRDEGDWKSSTPCRHCGRRYWRQDGCSCEGSAPRKAPLPSRSPLSSGGAAEDHLIAGLHPALAEHTLERCINAWGGLSGLLVAIDAWEAEPHAS